MEDSRQRGAGVRFVWARRLKFGCFLILGNVFSGSWVARRAGAGAATDRMVLHERGTRTKSLKAPPAAGVN